jgi:hypothetical protein
VQNPANGSRNFPRRQTCRRHLIQKRLEGVVVLAVNQCDGDVSVPELTSRLEATETASDDHDAGLCGL